MRILIVEDHPDSADMLARILRGRGHHVESVGTAAEALHRCVDHTFDLLVADLGLPDFDGWELLRRLREKCAIRGVALSAYARTTDIDKSLATGFDAHLTKPVDFATLVATVEGPPTPA
jgi:CheY-like chemotaxis protein